MTKTDKECNRSNTPIQTNCNACNLTFSTQKGIDDHYRNPKCLKVQQIIQDMEKSEQMPKSIWEPIVLLEDKKPKEKTPEERIKELELKLSAVSNQRFQTRCVFKLAFFRLAAPYEMFSLR